MTENCCRRSRDFKTIMVPADAAKIGDYLTVQLTGTTGATFTGTPVSRTLSASRCRWRCEVAQRFGYAGSDSMTEA